MQRINTCLATLRDHSLAGLLRLACQAAMEGGRILRDLENQPHDIRQKGLIDLVTEADIASEKKILSLFAEQAPDIAILSEESAADFASAGDAPCWVIDPLDGTTNFAHSYPWYAVSIACLERRIPRLGVVYQVPGDHLFLAVRGSGAFLDGHKISVSSEANLQQSLLATGFPYNIKEKIGPVGKSLLAVLPNAQGLRRAGSAALDLAHLAAGHFEGFWETGLKPWDTAAGMLLVEEAGGRLSDFNGKPFDPFRGEILATNGLIHDALRKLLAGWSS